jgi:hypothetical protein
MRGLFPPVALAFVSVMLQAPVPPPAQADVPRAMPERQRSEATHIVRGWVHRVYTGEERTVAGKTDTPCLVEVAVNKVDKGKGPSTDRPLYVRGWKSKIPQILFDRTITITVLAPPGGPTTERQQTFKEEGYHGPVWVYFRANRDGGYDLLEPNGIEIFSVTKP